MLFGQGSVTTSDVVNGALVTATPGYAIAPAAFGPQPVSYDMYAATPTLPPYSGQAPNSVAPSGGGTQGSDQTNTTAAAVAMANPFNWKLSPLMWSMLFLFVGLAGLRIVHWGRG